MDLPLRTIPRRIAVFLSLTGLFLLSSSPLRAETGGAVTTVVKTWSEEGEKDASAALYLRVDSESSTERFLYRLEGYGRALAVREEPPEGDSNLSRLYVLFLGVEDRKGRFSAAAGRQMLTPVTGAKTLDGISFFLGSGDLSFSARWGRVADVAGGSPSGTRDLGLGGTWRMDPGMFLAFDYDRTDRDGARQTEAAGIDWSYSWHRFTRAWITLDYDLMSRTFSEAVYGTRLHFSDTFTLSFEHAEKIPVFASDSIYSVFAVEAAKKTAFSILLSASDELRYHWDYALESFQDGGGGKRYTVGVRWEPPGAAYGADLSQEKVDAGDLTEVTASAAFPLLPGFALGLGGEAARSQMAGKEAVRSWGANLAADWTLSADTKVTARLERAGTEGDVPSSWSFRLAATREFR